ncbi:MAG: tetratricopeptide repeat protein [Bryobacteraceae bacterium]
MFNRLSGPSFLGTLGMVFIAIAALWIADTFLAKTELAETKVEAKRLFEQGRDLMNRGENLDAIDHIKDAISIERGNRDYIRMLAQAQFAAGKTKDAEATLTDLLQRDAGDGLASLIMARVLVKEDRIREAISYFHRAIYGQWSENAAENRLRARFELIDLMAERSKEELLAELLAVQDHAPNDLKTRLRMGSLFLLAGSPTRAGDVFKGILRDAPANADAYAGLGESEFARANYRSAQRDFQVALRLAPDNQTTRRRLDACNELLTLDPMIRGLGIAERFRRSLKLVELTVAEIGKCAGETPSVETQDLIDKANKALKATVRFASQAEAAESNLDVAEQLWQARKKDCKTPPPTDSPLALVLARLAQ